MLALMNVYLPMLMEMITAILLYFRVSNVDMSLKVTY